MLLDTMRKERRLQLSLYLLSLLGGFPYRRNRESKDVKKKSLVESKVCFLNEAAKPSRKESKSASKHYQASLGLRFWAGCVALVMLCHVIAAVMQIPQNYHAFRHQKTLRVANKVREIITSLTIVAMEAHIMSTSSLAILTADQCLDLLPASRGHSSKLFADVSVAVSSVLFIISSISVLISYVIHIQLVPNIEQGVLYLFTQYVETIIYILVNAFVITYLYTVIQIQCGAFEAVREQLKEAWTRKAEEEPPLPTISYSKHCLGETKAKLPKNSLGSCTHLQTKYNVNKFGEDLGKVTKNIRVILAQVHALQRSLKRFLGLPITLIMLISVVYSILACFFLSYIGTMTVAVFLMSISYFTMALVPQLLLSNFPVLLQNQVRKQH